MIPRTLAAAVVLANLAASAYAQAKPAPPKKDELPDVSLLIPEDARPELKAIIKDNALRLVSTKASERAKAAQVLGERGEEGKPIRVLLCRAMLDPVPEVRVAAADADLSAAAVRPCAESLTAFAQRYLPLFHRQEQRGHALTVLRGALVGRNVLFCGDDDPAAIAEAINGVVHERRSAIEAIAQGAKVRGTLMDLFG
jgi:hypothetical protein